MAVDVDNYRESYLYNTLKLLRFYSLPVIAVSETWGRITVQCTGGKFGYDAGRIYKLLAHCGAALTAGDVTEIYDPHDGSHVVLIYGVDDASFPKGFFARFEGQEGW